MASLPASRRSVVWCLLVTLASLCPKSSGQVLPFPPLFPKSPQECQAFGAAVETWAADYSKQHERCLASNKPDRSDEPQGSLVCSRSACQYLHDILYGDYVLSVKSKEKEVSDCYTKVEKYRAEDARKAKEIADQEAQDKKEEEEEAARRLRAKDNRDAQDKQTGTNGNPRLQWEQSKSEAGTTDDSDHIAAQAYRTDRSQPALSAPDLSETSHGSRQSTRSSPLVDPFKDSESKRLGQEIAGNQPIIDPFAPKESLADPFADSRPSGEQNEESWDTAKGIFQGFVDKASDNLGDVLKSTQKDMSSSDFNRFKQTVGDAHSFLTGLSKTITALSFQADVKKIIDNPRDSQSYHDIISDGASYGTSYVLKRLSPDFLSKIWEGPAGWIAAITFDSSSTQTPKQDFDPMTALNNPDRYSFKDREAALQSLYESAQKHPEVWTQPRYKWLYSVSERLYNSPDNPNIHLTPP
jgi:hypothetical protein